MEQLFTFVFGFIVGFAIYGLTCTHSLEDCEKSVNENKLIESAKTKLTPEEIKALNL